MIAQFIVTLNIIFFMMRNCLSVGSTNFLAMTLNISDMISEIVEVWLGQNLDLLEHFWVFFAKYLPLSLPCLAPY